MPFELVSTQLMAYQMYTFIAVVLGCALVKTSWSKSHKRNPKNLPLPPGPKGYPVIGNLFDVPNPLDSPHIVYDQWFKKYGDMIYIEVLGQSLLILGSLQRATDLLDKRSSNYSDRMRMPMVLELMNWVYNMAFLPYGQWWRRHRKAFNEHFHRNIVHKYYPIQQREIRTFLYRLLRTPDNFMHHIRHTFSSTIMGIAYGITVEDSADPYISNAEKALEGLVEAGIPGTFLVDLIPALLYVPAWLPGAGFKKKAAYWSKINDDVINKPFEYIENELRNDRVVVPSVTTSLISRLPDKSDPLYFEERKIAQHTAAVAYIGGADTTVSTVQSFFLAMAMYPEAQKKAQAELDAVVGSHRLPDFGDRKSLPYINAVVKESMRWNQVLPLSIGHMASEDDEYDGYFIPRGTVVLANGWSILHDPEVFSEPMKFEPDRYLKNGKLDPSVRSPDCAAFGYGRRICPGRHLSDNSLYLIVSSVLSVYDIEPSIDKLGKPIKLEPNFAGGFLSYPVPFQCSIKPRSTSAEQLIRDIVELDR
ncbi:Cytochrome P450 monooxygenase COX2 [Psilocybe cubensis]|uniref:O-methylsterigmatocystin oxidoreductase n=2 Tax=Psilocybe cubensis TaxID=181762 RepID=A0A8H7YC43_PSICU|nr:Cytochrome P450 monooxygenase COX2 [Psilocybe cubensis]KAH9487255.1 Cytochrome P450 monooxygenase COX2 [Psilocybe cubensis]